MAKRIKLLFEVLLTMFVVSATAQVESIASPAELESVISLPRSLVVRTAHLGTITSSDAQAIVSAITVEGPEGQHLRGIQIQLVKGDITEWLYIGERLLPVLTSELNSLGRTFPCTARLYCVNGIARCGPSRIQSQAYCVGYYTTPGEDEGLMLSTPTHYFQYPSIQPSVLVQIIDEYNK